MSNGTGYSYDSFLSEPTLKNTNPYYKSEGSKKQSRYYDYTENSHIIIEKPTRQISIDSNFCSFKKTNSINGGSLYD